MHTLMQSKNSNVQTNDLASIVGKRFVSASEGEAGQKLAESKIKLLSGGDRIVCRYLHKEYFEFDPQFKLWLATNNLPSVSGADDAIWRRIRVIEFPVSIPSSQQDKELPAKLLKELPGIFNWALKGYHQWKESGLCPPERVLNATASYRDENDTVQQWIDARCYTAPNKATSMKDLYASYCEWCATSGIEPKSNAMFGKDLSSKGFESKRRREGNYRLGLGLSL